MKLSKDYEFHCDRKQIVNDIICSESERNPPRSITHNRIKILILRTYCRTTAHPRRVVGWLLGYDQAPSIAISYPWTSCATLHRQVGFPNSIPLYLVLGVGTCVGMTWTSLSCCVAAPQTYRCEVGLAMLRHSVVMTRDIAPRLSGH